MADITQLQDLELSQSSTATNPVVTVARKISDSETDLITSSTLVDKDGSTITKACILGIRKANGYVENVYVAAAGITGTAVTITTRGLKLGGIDFTATLAGNAVSHEQGEEVFLNVSPFELQQIVDALQGDIATGGTGLKVGDGTDVDVTLTAFNGDTNAPFFQYASATSEWLYSNNGVDTTPFGTGAGVTGGDGITVTAGDIDIDTTDTTVFVNTSGGAGDENKAPILNGSGELANNFIPTASQGEAEAGTDDTVFMTPLKTQQAIDDNTVAPDSSISIIESSTGLVGTTTTADLTIPLGDSGFTHLEIDILIGAANSTSPLGNNGNVKRDIVKRIMLGDYFIHRGQQSTFVDISTTSGNTPAWYANVSKTLSSISHTNGGTTTTTINSISIVGSDLKINYTVTIGDAGISAGIVRVLSYLVSK